MNQYRKDRIIERLGTFRDIESAFSYIQGYKKADFAMGQGVEVESHTIHEQTLSHLQKLFNVVDGTYLIYMHQLSAVFSLYGFKLEITPELEKRHARALLYKKLSTY